MFEEILISALSEFDDNTLNYILESCTEDELNYIDMAIEAVSDADRDQLRSGYKLDVHNGLGGLVKSFKNSGTDKWKNLAHDAKTEVARIKNNLKGDGDQTSVHFGDNDAQKVKDNLVSSYNRAKRAVNKYDERRNAILDAQKSTNEQTREVGQRLQGKYDKYTDSRNRLESHMVNIRKNGQEKIENAYANNKNAQRNVGSLSYRLGNGLKTLREGIKNKINTWKANRQRIKIDD